MVLPKSCRTEWFGGQCSYRSFIEDSPLALFPKRGRWDCT